MTGTFAYEDAYMDRPSIKPNQMQLDNLRPEIVTSYNVGLEGSFKRNMIRFSFDYYNNETSDLIMKDMNIQSTTVTTPCAGITAVISATAVGSCR